MYYACSVSLFVVNILNIPTSESSRDTLYFFVVSVCVIVLPTVVYDHCSISLVSKTQSSCFAAACDIRKQFIGIHGCIGCRVVCRVSPRERFRCRNRRLCNMRAEVTAEETATRAKSAARGRSVAIQLCVGVPVRRQNYRSRVRQGMRKRRLARAYACFSTRHRTSSTLPLVAVTWGRLCVAAAYRVILV